MPTDEDLPPPPLRLRMARIAARLKQAEVADLLGISVVTYRRIESENGSREPTVDELIQVAAICNVPEGFMREGWAALDRDARIIDRLEAERTIDEAILRGLDLDRKLDNRIMRRLDTLRKEVRGEEVMKALDRIEKRLGRRP